MLMIQRQLFGFPICASVTRLDDGVHVLLTGGCRTHVGAISVSEPKQPTETKVFPGHKDQLISEPWAEALAGLLEKRAVVACGIHYDAASKMQILEILRCTEEMLQEILENISMNLE